MIASRVPVRARYLTALGVLVLIGLIQAIALARLIGDQRQVGLTVNLAGRQRMLSQRIPSLARDLALSTNPIVRGDERSALLAAAAQMELRDSQLASGDPAVGPKSWPPAAARALYFDPPISLNAQVRDYVARARAFARTPNALLRIDDPNLNYLIARRDAVLAGEDRVVRAYVSDGERRQVQIVTFVIVLLVVQVIVIAAILLLLFIPMERQIESQRLALVNENTGLSAVVAGSQALAETLAIESLIARFVEGAQRLLHVPVVLLGEGDHAAIGIRFDSTIGAADESTRELLEKTFATRRLEHSADGRSLALAIDVFEGEPRLAVSASAGVPFRRADMVALELFATNLLLAAHNATLFHDLEERRARVVELDQLKSDLIAMLAHDFKGPLTSIIGYAELMREGIIEGKELEDAVGFIMSSAWRLSSLASDTLTMSLLERNEFSLERSPVDLVELVRDATQGAGGANRARFRSEIPSLEIDADARRLHQVFENLVGNALKYSPNGEPVDVTMTRAENVVRISVTDRGIGIPRAELDRVFDRFSRATNAKSSGISGTGFGLYLVKMLVELHGGQIELRSTQFQGSTFTVVLPVVASTSSAAAPRAASENSIFTTVPDAES